MPQTVKSNKKACKLKALRRACVFRSGVPVDWMWHYFDVHVYVVNWGTCFLYLRVPISAFDANTLQVFKTKAVLLVKQAKTHWLLEWGLDESDNYDRFAEEDGGGWMGRQ